MVVLGGVQNFSRQLSMHGIFFQALAMFLDLDLWHR